MRQWPVFLKEIAAFFLLLFLLFSFVGCSGNGGTDNSLWTEAPMGGYGQEKLVSIKITAGDTAVYGMLFDNQTSQDFAGLLPLTVPLWTPAVFAKAFDLDTQLYDPAERTWEYQTGGLAYWPEGPSIAIFHGEDRERTAVPVILIGKLESNVDVFADYIGEITIEIMETDDESS